jgi:hypothetical protein
MNTLLFRGLFFCVFLFIGTVSYGVADVAQVMQQANGNQWTGYVKFGGRFVTCDGVPVPYHPPKDKIIRTSSCQNDFAARMAVAKPSNIFLSSTLKEPSARVLQARTSKDYVLGTWLTPSGASGQILLVRSDQHYVVVTASDGKMRAASALTRGVPHDVLKMLQIAPAPAVVHHM